MRLIRMRLTFAGICLVLAGTPLVGQQPGPSAPGPGGRRMMPPMAGMPMMDCPMMMNGPASALRAGSALGISAGQRAKLVALQRQLDVASKPGMDSMRVIHAQLSALALQPKLDEGAARTALDRAGRVHTELGLAMLRAAHDASALLTPAQRDSLAAITQRQMARGEMPMCGMPMHPMPGAGAPPKR